MNNGSPPDHVETTDDELSAAFSGSSAAAPADLPAVLQRADTRITDLEFARFLDCSPVPTFVLNANHYITHWNKACEHVLGYRAELMLDTRNQWKPFYRSQRPVLADLIMHNKMYEEIQELYEGKIKPSFLDNGACCVDDYFENLGEGGLWLHFTAALLLDKQGEVVGAVETLEDITERKEAEKALRLAHANLELVVKRRTEQLADANRKLALDIQEREKIEAELIRRNSELNELNTKLVQTQEQLVQSEKLASIGQLAAGVAHEINNPIGYIFSNFTSLENYVNQLLELIYAYERIEPHIATPSALGDITMFKEKIELAYLKEDIPDLILQSKEGISRVRQIVNDLKDFSRTDSNQEWQWSDLHDGINSTLNIVSNEIKYKADVIKEYGDIPEVECMASQINQVIMNLVVNAAHAMGEQRGRIVIRTSCTNDQVQIVVEDNGTGIAPDIIGRIFDPFFTTKPMGKGTGLGLSLSYGIVKKHDGQITVDSELGKGTRFSVYLPVRRHSPNDDQGRNDNG